MNRSATNRYAGGIRTTFRAGRRVSASRARISGS